MSQLLVPGVSGRSSLEGQSSFKIGLLEKVFREFGVKRFLDWADRSVSSDVDSRPSIAKGCDLLRIFDPLVREVFAGADLDPDLVRHDFF